jgi:Mg2+/Co2+ transporter CorC
MKKLEFNSIGAVDDLCWPIEKSDISITSPAMLFFTDFEKVNPLVIDESITAKLSKSVKRESITVTDLMLPKREIKGFDFLEIKYANIGTVIHHLKDSGQQHCLVVDKQANKIRGIFSASDISRKLKLPINVQDKSNFYKVFTAITS